MTGDSELARWTLLGVSGIGAATFAALMERGADAGAILRDPGAWQPPLKASQVRAIREFRGHDDAARDMARLKEIGASCIWWDSPQYPGLLRQVSPPPPVLFCLGDGQPLLDGYSVAIVGTRDPSSHAEGLAYEFGQELAKTGITVVSGFAFGIDTAAHQGAVDAGGRTIAVLGCGLRVEYPRRTDGLKDRIRAGGALVSEFGPDTTPRPEFFRQRNRVISGLSMGVVVVEGTETSGSLVTARHALEQNRLVFAVPGRARDPRAAGPHQLLREGAILAESAADVIEQIAPMLASNRSSAQYVAMTGKGQPGRTKQDLRQEINPFAESPLTSRLWELLSSSPEHIDVLASKSGLDVQQTMSLLLEMELTGRVVQSAGMQFARQDTRRRR